MNDYTASSGDTRRATAGLASLAAALARLRGWPRALAAAGFGALAAFGLPPAYIVPVFFIAFPGLLWLLNGVASKRAAFIVGWSFGFGLFVTGLYWVAWSMTVDLAAFWWMIPFAVAGLPALLGIFTGVATLVLWALGWTGLGQVFAFAVLWAVAEWLRGHVLTGFPWHLIGYGWVAWTPVLQSVAWIGIYGLSLVTVLVAALPAAFGLGERRDRATIALMLGLLLLIGLAAAGAMRLAGATDTTVPNVTLRLVQPNVSQLDKGNRDLWPEIFRLHLELSASPGWDAVTHVIWPETAVPYLLERDPEARAAIGQVTPPDGALLTGAPRIQESGGPRQVFNSLQVLNRSGAIVATFDKFHLVPFGEYVPLRNVLPVSKITPGQLDFAPGPGPQTLNIPGLPPVSPLICYEAIFPGKVTAPEARPDWLVNITNDAWFGQTAGPHQHFAIARTRAVEEGLPLVRVATTGISGIVDPYGRIAARLGLDERGVIDAPLPASLPTPTLYARTGDQGFLILLAATAIIGFFQRRPS